MTYESYLKQLIQESGMSMRKISKLCEEQAGVKVSQSYLSQLINGETTPASEKINAAISDVLNGDYEKLETLGYMNKAPSFMHPVLRSAFLTEKTESEQTSLNSLSKTETYQSYLKQLIKDSGMSLSQICNELKNSGFSTDKGYLSKLQNGKLMPAGKKMNYAIANITNGDPEKLETLSYLSKAPDHIQATLNATFLDVNTQTEQEELTGYSVLLDVFIIKSGKSPSEISKACEEMGVSVTVSYLSKLRNGKMPAPSYKVSAVLAGVLGVSPKILIAAGERDNLSRKKEEFDSALEFYRSKGGSGVAESKVDEPLDDPLAEFSEGYAKVIRDFDFKSPGKDRTLVRSGEPIKKNADPLKKIKNNLNETPPDTVTVLRKDLLALVAEVERYREERKK